MAGEGGESTTRRVLVRGTACDCAYLDDLTGPCERQGADQGSEKSKRELAQHFNHVRGSQLSPALLHGCCI